MLYCTQGKEGDIIIDCGYTKAFINMSTEDISTWRYIQNLAGFLSRPDAHMIYDDGETAKNYRPNGIDFKINYSKLYNKFDKYAKKGELDVVYMIDSTGSMMSWINGVKNKCKEILNKLNENKKLKNYDIKFGGVFYRDPVDCITDKHEYKSLGDVDSLKTKMETISAEGGGDAPEDWYGAYQIVLDELKMKWRKNSLKIIIHIADAGAHTLRFNDYDFKHNESEYEYGLVEYIKKCAEKNISIFGYQIGDEPQKSFNECKKIYDQVKSKECNYEIEIFENASDQIIAEKLKENIINNISTFIAKK